MAKKASGPTRGAEHEALIERERVLVAAAGGSLEKALAALAVDRAQRWRALLEAREETAAVREWATKMTLLYGVPRVRIWNNVLPWVVALYVAKYGEAEDAWPEALTEEDALRAERWFLGDAPEGVRHLPREG